MFQFTLALRAWRLLFLDCHVNYCSVVSSPPIKFFIMGLLNKTGSADWNRILWVSSKSMFLYQKLFARPRSQRKQFTRWWCWRIVGRRGAGGPPLISLPSAFYKSPSLSRVVGTDPAPVLARASTFCRRDMTISCSTHFTNHCHW